MVHSSPSSLPSAERPEAAALGLWANAFLWHHSHCPSAPGAKAPLSLYLLPHMLLKKALFAAVIRFYKPSRPCFLGQVGSGSNSVSWEPALSPPIGREDSPHAEESSSEVPKSQEEGFQRASGPVGMGSGTPEPVLSC